MRQIQTIDGETVTLRDIAGHCVSPGEARFLCERGKEKAEELEN
jgi:hypothetical protein